MSDQQNIELSYRIVDGIKEAQRRMFIRKAKLGECVIVADADGKHYKITAEEALRRYYPHTHI